MEHVNISENTVWAWEKCSMEHVNISENTVWAWEKCLYTQKMPYTHENNVHNHTCETKSHAYTCMYFRSGD